MKDFRDLESLCKCCTTEECNVTQAIKEDFVVLKCDDYQKDQEGLSIGDAVQAMKNGKFVARKGWDGSNMYLYLDSMEGYAPYIVMHTADGLEQPGWLASQADLLSEDWVVY